MLEQLFPGLARSGYAVTSPRDRDYNCVAWAAGDTANRWWPGPNDREEHWPPGASREVTLAAFQAAFALLGYATCKSAELESGYLKIALFADRQGKPTHGARQLPSGRWTSKLGRAEDIEHDLRDLTGDVYGDVVLLMSRRSP